MLPYDLMIPSSVNIENKVFRLDIVLRNKKEKTALLIEISVTHDFGLNNSPPGRLVYVLYHTDRLDLDPN